MPTAIEKALPSRAQATSKTAILVDGWMACGGLLKSLAA